MRSTRDISVSKSPPVLCCTINLLTDYSAINVSAYHLTNSGLKSQKAFQPKLLIVLFYVLFVCKCILYYCHRVSTQLRLAKICIKTAADLLCIWSCWRHRLLYSVDLHHIMLTGSVSFVVQCDVRSPHITSNETVVTCVVILAETPLYLDVYLTVHHELTIY